jgi:hypothetical protein
MDVLEPEPVDAPPPVPQEEDPFADMGQPYDIAPEPPPPYAGPVGGGGGGGGEQRKPCPMCGEMIPINAMKCRFCNTIFDPALRKQEAKRKKAIAGAAGDDDLTAAEWLVAILCSGIGCIIGIVWMVQGKPKGKKMFLISIISSAVGAALRAAIESGRR